MEVINVSNCIKVFTQVGVDFQLRKKLRVDVAREGVLILTRRLGIQLLTYIFKITTREH